MTHAQTAYQLTAPSRSSPGLDRPGLEDIGVPQHTDSTTGLKVFLSAEGQPVAWPKAGPSSERIIVCSIPKAGTYLLATFLQEMGLENAGLHLHPHLLADYRFASLNHARYYYKDLLHSIDLKDSLRLLGPGQFMVSHLEYDPQTLCLLEGYRVLFIWRDVRDALISYMRFLESTGRDGAPEKDWYKRSPGPDQMLLFLRDLGRWYLDWCRGISAWVRSPCPEQLTFESLHGGTMAGKRKSLTSGACSSFVGSRRRSPIGMP